MDISQAHEQRGAQKAIVKDVLTRYTEQHGCPCGWPQFEYWVSKPQGAGWQDNIQNDLVECARDLPCFYRQPTKPAEYGQELGISCSNCGRGWRYSSEEWRMLAFHDRLIPIKPLIDAKTFEGVSGESIFATAGCEPAGIRLLSMAEWANFMLGESYQLTQSTTLASDTPKGSQPIVRRIISWLMGRT